MPSGNEKLEQFQNPDQDDRQAGHQHSLPGIGEGEGEAEQDESQRVLAIMGDGGVRAGVRRSERRKGDGGGEQPSENPQKYCHGTAITRFARGPHAYVWFTMFV